MSMKRPFIVVRQRPHPRRRPKPIATPGRHGIILESRELLSAFAIAHPGSHAVAESVTPGDPMLTPPPSSTGG